MDYSNRLRELTEKHVNNLMQTIEKHGTLHPIFGREHIREDVTPQTLDEMYETAEKMAKAELEKEIKGVELKHPRYGDSEKTIKVERGKPSLASQLDDIGPQGSILKQKLEEAGIDLNKVKDVSELKSPRLSESKPYIIPMDERARIIDVGALKEAEANKLALQRLGKLAKGGALGLGALATASDVLDKNEVGAALDVAETGLGLAGGIAGRAAPFLELLRPTSTQTQEQEEAELAKYRRLNNMLTEEKKKSRMPASEE
jgi:hypothetical protein